VAVVEPQLDHLAWGVLGDQLPWRSLSHNLSQVHDDQPIAQMFSLDNVVGADYKGVARMLQPIE
jgi:hypothetical protein